MPDDPQDRSSKEILSDLSIFLGGAEDEVQDDIVSVREQLYEEGIDTQPLKEWAFERIGALKAQAILRGPKEKRLRLLELMEQVGNRLVGELLPQKEAILARVQAMSDSNPDAAQVFCRKFEEASDEDLPGLVQDLEMLGKMSEANEGDDA